MSKIYKATIYIDDINGMYDYDGDIKNCLQRGLDDAHIELDNLIEVDTTEYIEEVEDDYKWNTTDKKKFVEEIEKFINTHKRNEVHIDE